MRLAPVCASAAALMSCKRNATHTAVDASATKSRTPLASRRCEGTTSRRRSSLRHPSARRQVRRSHTSTATSAAAAETTKNLRSEANRDWQAVSDSTACACIVAGRSPVHDHHSNLKCTFLAYNWLKGCPFFGVRQPVLILHQTVPLQGCRRMATSNL
ncbi:hypothetical protein PR003_g1919 [Phytophthora rubi]|uniref:Uncharacterized protein n=1 Tax=Phytophthora rubi TaxID=129364 RepID=A0A6A4FZQ5_9STRA|nr:hypothetical protein PR002_g5183 [Phytophthora rubi]KAE9051094.1 hypothetical protein PR001_g1760 [Phytophthora rubi]KAE9357183.1 hypothetical protein PR003_g1919 [Phytophthora rubi]